LASPGRVLALPSKSRLAGCPRDPPFSNHELLTTVNCGGTDGYPYLTNFVHSHFTHGIVTFFTGYLFVTEPGWDLLATGPFNEPRDGITPLTGIIETDWLPYPFTMNWHLTRPGTVRFERGDPFCLIFPVQRAALESADIEIYDLKDSPELAKEYEVWLQKREEFMVKFHAEDEATVKQAWQKYYFQGVLPEHTAAITDHKQKIRFRIPVDRRGS
jgi:hypothetical protein